MQNYDRIRLQHMLEAAEEAISFIEGKTRSSLEQDRMLEFALVRAVEIIGEAAAQVTQQYRMHVLRSLGTGLSGCGTASYTLILM